MFKAQYASYEHLRMRSMQMLFAWQKMQYASTRRNHYLLKFWSNDWGAVESWLRDTWSLDCVNICLTCFPSVSTAFERHHSLCNVPMKTIMSMIYTATSGTFLLHTLGPLLSNWWLLLLLLLLLLQQLSFMLLLLLLLIVSFWIVPCGLAALHQLGEQLRPCLFLSGMLMVNKLPTHIMNSWFHVFLVTHVCGQ